MIKSYTHNYSCICVSQGSGKTEFLALFINWYIMHLFKETSSKDRFIIGVTAFTRHAIMNLLQRIATVRQRHSCTDSFTIISMKGSDDSHEVNTNEMIQCKAQDLKKTIKSTGKGPLVVGGTVWDWYKVKNEWRTWQGCSMIIIDESTQVSSVASRKRNRIPYPGSGGVCVWLLKGGGLYMCVCV